MYPKSIKNLIETFSDLPSVGPKTAERYVFYLLTQDPEKLQKFAQSIAELKEKTRICKTCNCVNEQPEICLICADAKRNQNLLCIVVTTRDMLTIESSRKYNGLYYCLGNKINAIRGVGPAQLNINKLLNYVKTKQIKEIILALDPNIEGETTIMYLVKTLKDLKIKITRLARGLPMGATLEYADEMTLSNALRYRNEINFQ